MDPTEAAYESSWDEDLAVYFRTILGAAFTTDDHQWMQVATFGVCYPVPACQAVDLPSLGWHDCFIYNIIKVMINQPNQVARHSASAPLAIHLSMRPHTGDKDPIP